MLYKSLHQQSFVKVLSHALQGLHLIIFVQDKYSKQIKNKNVSILKKGCYGFMGNKGGICIEFDVKNQGLNFINVHLAA